MLIKTNTPFKDQPCCNRFKKRTMNPALDLIVFVGLALTLIYIYIIETKAHVNKTSQWIMTGIAPHCINAF